jgi:hypothetical protein
MSNNLKVLPQLTVGATALQVAHGYTNPASGNAFTGETFHKWASITIESDPANAAGTLIYIGNSLLTSTKKARTLNPGDWYTVSGSAIDPNKLYVLGSTTGLLVNVSGT